MNKILKFFLILSGLLTIFFWTNIARSPQDDNLVKIFFLDVGQGDSALIERGDYQILIDGGPGDKVLSELGKVMPLTDRTIEIVILSHPHADHLTGLNHVLDRYEIGQIYSEGVVHTSDVYLNFLEKVKTKNIPINVPEIGEEVAPFPDAKLTFIWPGKIYQEQSVENLNNASLVNRFCYFNQCAFFTGDIESDEQGKMLNYYLEKKLETDWQSAIIKVSHHGSNNGLNINVYDIIIPRYALIPVGDDNKYGHPHQSVIDYLESKKIEVHRTDQEGTVKFIMGREGVTTKQ